MNGWGYNLKVTILASKVSGTLTDFPIYVDLSNLPDNFFQNVQSTGADIRVTKSDQSTEVPLEVVSISTTSKTGELWFKSDVSSQYDTDFYIFYGNPFAVAYATGATYGSQNVWTGYVGVWHLGASGSTQVDSTGNSNGTVSGTVTSIAGKVGKASHFDATIDSNIFIPDPAGLTNFDTADSYSISFWCRRWISTTFSDKSISEHWQNTPTATNGGYPWAIRGFTGATPSLGNGIYNGGASFAPSGQTFNPGYPSTGNIGENTWGYITYIKDRANLKLNTYLNSVKIGSGNTDTVPNGDSTQTVNNGFVIGERTSTGTTRTPNLDIQQFRLYTGVKSQSYLTTEYRNQSSASTFYQITQASRLSKVIAWQNKVPFPIKYCIQCRKLIPANHRDYNYCDKCDKSVKIVTSAKKEDVKTNLSQKLDTLKTIPKPKKVVSSPQAEIPAPKSMYVKIEPKL